MDNMANNNKEYYSCGCHSCFLKYHNHAASIGNAAEHDPQIRTGSWPEPRAVTKCSPTPIATRTQRLRNQRLCYAAGPKRGILAESFCFWKKQSASRIAHAQRVRQAMLERYRADERYAKSELCFLSQRGRDSTDDDWAMHCYIVIATAQFLLWVAEVEP